MTFEKHVFCDSKFQKSMFYEAFSYFLCAPGRADPGSRAGTIGMLRDCVEVIVQRLVVVVGKSTGTGVAVVVVEVVGVEVEVVVIE